VGGSVSWETVHAMPATPTVLPKSLLLLSNYVAKNHYQIISKLQSQLVACFHLQSRISLRWMHRDGSTMDQQSIKW
jgi:hypothetical protein